MLAPSIAVSEEIARAKKLLVRKNSYVKKNCSRGDSRHLNLMCLIGFFFIKLLQHIKRLLALPAVRN
jgi:hypothetical protein